MIGLMYATSKLFHYFMFLLQLFEAGATVVGLVLVVVLNEEITTEVEEEMRPVFEVVVEVEVVVEEVVPPDAVIVQEKYPLFPL